MWPSRRLAAAVAGLHAATMALPWLAGFSPAVGVGAGILVLGHCLYAVRQALLVTPGSVVGIELGPGPACRLRRRDGSVADGRIAESTIVTGSLVVLAVTVGRRRTAAGVPILAWTVDAETFRVLRVRLRWANRSDGATTATPS